MKKKPNCGIFGLLAMSAGISSLSAITVTWDAANNDWTSTSLGGQAWVDYDSAVFNTAGSHTITVGPNVLVGKPDNNNAVVINFTSGNYVFNGDGLTIRNADAAGGGDSDIRVANNSQVTFNNRITSANNGGNLRFQPQGNDAVLNLNGGITATHQVTLGNFNNGTINLNVGGSSNVASSVTSTLISSSNVNVGNATLNANNLLLYRSYFTVNDASAIVNFTSTGANAIQAGQSNELDSRVRIQAGDVNVAGGIVITSANRNASDSGTVNGAGRLEVSGGTLDVAGDIALVRAEGNGGRQNAIGNGNYIQTAGIVTARGILSGAVNGAFVADGVGSVGSISISGGELYIGSTGINRNAAGPIRENLTMTFSGGTIGATADHTSNFDMTLQNTATFKAADAADVSHDITLEGILSGSGVLAKTGGGSLTINGAVSNTYSGGTLISEGTLIAASAGSLGTSDLTLNALATLTLQSADAISDTAILFFESGGSINLDFVGADTLAGITNTTTSASIGAGLHTADDLNTFFGGTYFTGAGSLNVIPEPSAWLLAVSGLGAACLVRRRQS